MSEKKYLPHQQRVVEEYQDLVEKRSNLFKFMVTDVFNNLELKDQSLLQIQLGIMDSYIHILECRIKRFDELNTK